MSIPLKKAALDAGSYNKTRSSMAFFAVAARGERGSPGFQRNGMLRAWVFRQFTELAYSRSASS